MTETFKVRLPHTTHEPNYTIPAGVINSRVIFAYTHGQCHAMARALHEITKLPLSLIVGASIKETLNMSEEEIAAAGEVPDYAAAWHWDHAMVTLGSDHYLDIRGVLSAKEALVSQKDYLIVPSSLRQLNFLEAETNPARPNHEAARHYASLVLKTHLGAPRLAFAN